MKVPVKVCINGRWVVIEYKDDLYDDDGSHIAGETASNGNPGPIRISKSRNNSERKVFETLWHEITHVAMELTGHAELLGLKKEEAVVYGLESSMAPLFVFNPSAPIKWRDIEFPWEE